MVGVVERSVLAGRSDSNRPETLDTFVGQSDVLGRLRIVLGAAMERGELPDHLLFSGPPGLGKTTLAYVVANTLGLPVVATAAPVLEKPGDVASILVGLQTPTVVFIDEIHRMPRVVAESLYEAMEDYRLSLVVGSDSNNLSTGSGRIGTRMLQLDLVPFVLVGATTQTGLLPAPFLDRFGFTGRLQLYDTTTLATIVANTAKFLGFRLTLAGATAVASRSRGTPRVAKTLCVRVRDWAQLNNVDEVGADDTIEALRVFGIDSAGLDQTGLDILTNLCVRFDGGPVGLNTLAASVGEAPNTVEDVYEPFLLAQGFLKRTPRGRIATETAYNHLGLPDPTAL